MTPLALGIDIGGTKILVALVDGSGRVLREWRFETRASRGAAHVTETLNAAVAGVLGELAPGAGVLGVGVSAAGQVDVVKGRIAYASPTIPGWTGTPLKDLLVARFGLPVTVDNDANAAAFGEWWVGGSQAGDDLVMVTIGTGIGGGVVQGGQVLRGGRWRAGEIGHMIIVADGVRCNCGQSGCLEVYASGTAIARLAAEARPGWAPSTREVFELADAGDAVASGLLNRSIRSMAIALVSLASVLDPDVFLLGGGVASQPAYLPRLQHWLADPAVSGERGFPAGAVRLAVLGESAGAVGAAGQLLQTLGRLERR